jgi:hypothetical protein
MLNSTVTSGLAAAAIIATLQSAGAAEFEPRIAVPSPGVTGLNGCWLADRDLYGPYQLSFCLDRFGGSYRVTGGGLDCRADLTWRKSWNGYRFTMQRATCGNGTDWTADSFSCEVRATPVVHGAPSDEGLEPKIAVPSPRPEPAAAKLDCRYKPAVFGYPSRRFAAYRD